MEKTDQLFANQEVPKNSAVSYKLLIRGVEEERLKSKVYKTNFI